MWQYSYLILVELCYRKAWIRDPEPHESAFKLAPWNRIGIEFFGWVRIHMKRIRISTLVTSSFAELELPELYNFDPVGTGTVSLP
jgi:hypothetical protein